MALGSCGGDAEQGEGDDVAAGLPTSIDCGAYYRPLGDASTEGAVEHSVSLQTAGGARAEQSVEFDTMAFAVSSFTEAGGGEGESLSVSVTSSDGAVLTSVLYQLGSFDLADVSFSGGHGFTGLHYVNHDGAQLQFWCSAE